MMGNILLVNNGQGGFEEKADYYNLDLTNVTFGTVFFDADNDGDNDVHIGGMQINHTFEKLDTEIEFKKINNNWGFNLDNDFNNGVAIGDFNNDGFIDIVKNSVTKGNFIISKNSLWENQFATNNFIKIQVRGTISNYYGIGSKITVYTNGNAQHKRIACGESFSSQHSLIQHFGIHQTETIDSIVIQWPSDNISILTNIPANQVITITEPLYGCTDSLACNFHPLAQSENGSCRYTTDYYDCLGCINDSDEDGVCDELEIYGCDQYSACNYSADATENDGSCYNVQLYNISGPTEVEALEEMQYSYPAQSGSQYHWSIENGSILAGNQTAEVLVIWYEKEGGILSVKETNDENCQGEIAHTSVQIIPPREVLSSELWINPNPVVDRLVVNNLKSTPYSYIIYNSIGQALHEGNLDEVNNQIDVSHLETGLHFLRINNDDYFFNIPVYKK